MSNTVNQIVGGLFQDSEGNVLANGYLLFVLNQDGIVNTSVQVCAGYSIQVPLNSSGSVAASPVQNLWPTDVLTPSGNFYMVSAYSASGQLVWGPNPQSVLHTPSPFDLGTWIPGKV